MANKQAGPRFVCQKCGAQYAEDFPQQWGRLPETIGVGPEPCCVALVRDPTHPGVESYGVCRGQLHYYE